jgi:tetratricopeptide (TPR) repeat protein
MLAIGKRMIANHQSDLATQMFQRVVDKLPGRPEGYCGLGRLALMDSDPSPADRVQRAYELARKALAVGADFGPAHELMGIVLRNARSYGVELAGSMLQSSYFQRAVELDPSSDIALAALADESIDRGECEEAFDLLKRAAAHDTRLDGVYFKLAVFYQAKRDSVSQAEAYRRAKDLAPNLELASDYKNKILDMCGFRY